MEDLQPIEIKNARTQLQVREASIEGATFENVMLKGAVFNDVMMAGVKVVNANLDDLEIEGARLGGAYIHNIGVPPKGHPMYDPNAKMRPVKLEDCFLEGSEIFDCNLKGAKISDCDLQGVQINDCNIAGLTIDGVDVSKLLAAYRAGK